MSRKYIIAIISMILLLLSGCTRLKQGQTNILNDLVVDDYPGVRMELTEITSNGTSYVMKNNTDTGMSFGDWFELQEYREGQWYCRELMPTDERHDWVTLDIEIFLPQHSEKDGRLSWICYGELQPGKYRIIKDFWERKNGESDLSHTYYVSCEFEIAE